MDKTLEEISSYFTSIDDNFQNAEDPTIHLRLFIPKSNRSWYVADCKADENDYVLFAFEIESHYADCYLEDGEPFTYSFLKKAGEIVGASIQIDSSFVPTKLSVISASIE